MAKRPRSYEDDNCYSSKRFQIEHRVPMSRTPTSGWNYECLIDASTDSFQSKHLVMDYYHRQRLIDICYDIYDPRYGPYIYVHNGSELFHAVADACEQLAYERFISLLNLGYFYAGRSTSERNTLIVSEHILLHIEQSNNPRYDLYFEVEHKQVLKNHLECNQYGYIDHFQK